MRSGDPDLVPMPVGQIVGRMNEVRPVAEVMAGLLAEADAVLAKLGGLDRPSRGRVERTREYIEILGAVSARREPLRYDGKHYQLPLRGGTGRGKPLRSILHPYRDEIPVYLGAEGPKNVALAAEIADGW